MNEMPMANGAWHKRMSIVFWTKNISLGIDPMYVAARIMMAQRSSLGQSPELNSMEGDRGQNSTCIWACALPNPILHYELSIIHDCTSFMYCGNPILPN